MGPHTAACMTLHREAGVAIARCGQHPDMLRACRGSQLAYWCMISRRGASCRLCGMYTPFLPWSVAVRCAAHASTAARCSRFFNMHVEACGEDDTIQGQNASMWQWQCTQAAAAPVMPPCSPQMARFKGSLHRCAGSREAGRPAPLPANGTRCMHVASPSRVVHSSMLCSLCLPAVTLFIILKLHHMPSTHKLACQPSPTLCHSFHSPKAGAPSWNATTSSS